MIVVVGLGPAGADLLLPAARQAIEQASVRYVRTASHPAVAELPFDFIPLDHHYDGAPDLDAAYEGIVAELEQAPGDVLYAVPGSPAVAERTVSMLRSRGHEVQVIPGLSFADLAWARLGVEPGPVADARELRRETLVAGGSLLIAQCDSALVLSDVKLALLDAGVDSATLLHHLGLPDERIETVQLPDLDRSITPDHLTSVYVDLGEPEFARFVALIERLRRECPWDREQTHHSLTRHLVEEAYEVVEALEALPPEPAASADEEAYARVREELGDLCVQIVFHATLAQEAGAFTMADVLRSIREKLVRRHPHVFGDRQVADAGEVMRNWEQIKADEKAGASGARSFVADVPGSLPALLYAHKLLRKAASAGLPAMSVPEAAAAVGQAASRLATTEDGFTLVGDMLAALVVIARHQGFDAEAALRAWAGRFRDHFLALEALAADRGLVLGDVPPDKLAALWIESAPRS